MLEISTEAMSSTWYVETQSTILDKCTTKSDMWKCFEKHRMSTKSHKETMALYAAYMKWMMQNTWTTKAKRSSQDITIQLQTVVSTMSIVDFLPTQLIDDLRTELIDEYAPLIGTDKVPKQVKWDQQDFLANQVELCMISVKDSRIEHLGFEITKDDVKRDRCNYIQREFRSLQSIGLFLQLAFPNYKFVELNLIRYVITPTEKKWNCEVSTHTDGSERRDKREPHNRPLAMWINFDNKLPLEFWSIRYKKGRQVRRHLYNVTSADLVLMSGKTWHRTAQPTFLVDRFFEKKETDVMLNRHR
jgi:hypothetical protein